MSKPNRRELAMNFIVSMLCFWVADAVARGFGLPSWRALLMGFAGAILGGAVVTMLWPRDSSGT